MAEFISEWRVDENGERERERESVCVYIFIYNFFSWLAAPCSLWDLSSSTRNRAQPWQRKRRILTTRPPGNCPSEGFVAWRRGRTCGTGRLRGIREGLSARLRSSYLKAFLLGQNSVLCREVHIPGWCRVAGRYGMKGKKEV